MNSASDTLPVAVSALSFPDGEWRCSVVRRGVRRPSGDECDDSGSEALDPSAPRERRTVEDSGGVAGDNVRRSLASTRRALSDFIRFHGLTRLLTYTNGAEGDGWTSRSEALDAFSGWYAHGGGSALLSGTPYVAIAERGGRHGRWHIHVAIRSGGWLNYRAISASWSSWLESHGQHSSSGSHRWHSGDDRGRGARGFHSARIAARYLVKYVSKSLSADPAERYRHRFRAGGATAPTPDRWSAPSMADGLGSLGLAADSAGLYALRYERPDGRSVVFGYLYDSGG